MGSILNKQRNIEDIGEERRQRGEGRGGEGRGGLYKSTGKTMCLRKTVHR